MSGVRQVKWGKTKEGLHKIIETFNDPCVFQKGLR